MSPCDSPTTTAILQSTRTTEAFDLRQRPGPASSPRRPAPTELRQGGVGGRPHRLGGVTARSRADRLVDACWSHLNTGSAAPQGVPRRLRRGVRSPLLTV